MDQSVQFVSFKKFQPIVKESSFYMKIENIAELELNKKFVSKKIQFLDMSDNVWWIGITKISAYNLQLNFYIETEENIWKSNAWSYNVSGTVGKKIVHHNECLIYERCHGCSQTVAFLSSEPFIELKLKMTMLNRRSDLMPIQKFVDTSAQYRKIICCNKRILNESKYSDFTVIVQGTEFKVHKNILAAASPVFDRLFTAKLIETRTNECIVKDIEPVIFKYLLEFIYCGELPENLHEENITRKLFNVAHYYQIGELVELCKQEEHLKLSLENAEEMYKWAFTYELEELKMDAWKIIKFDILEIFDSMMPPSPESISALITVKKNNDKLLEAYRRKAAKFQRATKEQQI